MPLGLQYTTCADISSVSQLEDEKEVLLDLDSVFELIGIIPDPEKNDRWIIRLKGGYPIQHTLIFCQLVESDPKGLEFKYLAGWMLFGRVIKISKIEKMRFSSYFNACDESSSYLAFRSYEALEKKIVHEKLFVGSTSTR